MEQLRSKLTPQFELLDALCSRATEGHFGQDPTIQDDDPSAYDDMDDDNSPNAMRDVPNNGNTPFHSTRATTQAAATAAAADIAVGPPESRRLSIPSTWLSTDNEHRPIELTLRIKQATKTLQALRDSIADKSFQYSHVIRVAPKKGVRTRARATIAKLNHVIAYQSRVYARCRAAMARLGADDPTLNRFQILLKEHVRSSSALLNPNEPGSTRLQLSWIWQMGFPGNDGTPAALRECKLCPHILTAIYIKLCRRFVSHADAVNRVHWIRARAQKQRWKEEFILTGYEMQWTVRYFLHQASIWEDRGIVSEHEGHAGAAAYAHRKVAMWRNVAIAAESRFKEVNKSYTRLIML